MKALAKYWKLLLALVLVLIAAFLYFNKYQTEKTAHEASVQQMKTMITALNARLQEDMRYADIQDDLEGKVEELDASRLALYKQFPTEMKEEDQIMYVLYLETVFGTEIMFPFSQPVILGTLTDGANLKGLLLTVNYETTYKGFQEMIDYLATDTRIASIYEATIEYDAANDVAAGYLTLIVYLMDGYEEAQYVAPDVAVPETGKDNIFG